jgi:large subunit ribosomal protein L10
MKRAEKEQLVADLSAKIKGAKALYYTDFTGLNVKRITDLRRRLRKAGTEYVVIKNTLAARAVIGSGLAGERLHGPTAVVIGDDPVAAAKVLVDFAREFEKPDLKGGLLDGRPLDSKQVKRLATMPPREQMLAEMAAGLQSPLAGLAGALTGLLSSFVGALSALRTQREAVS